MFWVCERCGFHCSDSLDICPDCGEARTADAAVVEAPAATPGAEPEPARKVGRSKR